MDDNQSLTIATYTTIYVPTALPYQVQSRLLFRRPNHVPYGRDCNAGYNAEYNTEYNAMAVSSYINENTRE
jgi:hypothetical protein